MLTIRPEQMTALSECMVRQFEERMVVHLRKRFREQTQPMDDEGLRGLVHDGIGKAKGYGVTRENDVRRFLECMVAHGRDFDTAPRTAWAGTILADEALSGTEKMDRISDYETFALR